MKKIVPFELTFIEKDMIKKSQKNNIITAKKKTNIDTNFDSFEYKISVFVIVKIKYFYWSLNCLSVEQFGCKDLFSMTGAIEDKIYIRTALIFFGNIEMICNLPFN